MLLLFVPGLYLGAEPVGPFADAFAGSGGDGNYLHVGVELVHVGFACLDVEVEVRENVDFVDKQNVAYGEHERVLEGLVVAFGHGQDHGIF